MDGGKVMINWVRWLLLLPASLAAVPLLAVWISVIYEASQCQTLSGEGNCDTWMGADGFAKAELVTALAMGAVPALSIGLATAVAPRRRRELATVIFVFYAAIAGVPEPTLRYFVAVGASLALTIAIHFRVEHGKRLW